jgi:hypothetical protein
LEAINCDLDVQNSKQMRKKQQQARRTRTIPSIPSIRLIRVIFVMCGRQKNTSPKNKLPFF